ncbi:MAG TPA: hypothetical protein VD948_06620 [Rhodothermales bacterium]|nr:hypothetical protein [Rhodothermales bacterium]
MTLSEAIKAGAKKRPQAFGALYGTSEDGRFGTCAIGAAMEAIGRLKIRRVGREYVLTMEPDVAVPALLSTEDPESPCECEGATFENVARLIEHLNDHHRWRRETIAHWVKTLEDGK